SQAHEGEILRSHPPPTGIRACVVLAEDEGPDPRWALGPWSGGAAALRVTSMTTIDDDTTAGAPPPAETSEMAYSAGQAAWITLMSLVALVALALSIVAVVIANSDDGGSAAPASDGASSGPVTEAEVAASEFAFDPADVELVADEEVSVTLANDGAVEHNWTVLEQGTTVTSEDEIPDAP
ncbi:hypothetical protein B7486_76835, partial [cyanobacterium TDX16]